MNNVVYVTSARDRFRVSLKFKVIIQPVKPPDGSFLPQLYYLLSRCRIYSCRCKVSFRPTNCLVLMFARHTRYFFAIPVAAYALILPEAYRVGLALAFFLYPVTLELRPIIGGAILANMTSSQTESVPQDARNRDTLKAIAATVACIGCFSLSNVLSPLQFTDLLIVLACPLWHIQLSDCHHKALLTLLEDKSNLAAELQTERTSLEQSKQDLLCYIRCLVRAREDNNHLAKHVDELKTSKALEMDLTIKKRVAL